MHAMLVFFVMVMATCIASDSAMCIKFALQIVCDVNMHYTYISISDLYSVVYKGATPIKIK